MSLVFLIIAGWDTLVALINLLVLPHFFGAEVMKYSTVKTNLLPVCICLSLAAITSQCFARERAGK